MRVFFPLQLCLGGFVGFECIEVFQEKQLGGLLGVVQLAGTSSIFPENVVDIFEGLLEHVGWRLQEKVFISIQPVG